MPGQPSSERPENEHLRLPRPELAEVFFDAGKDRLPVLTDEALFESCGTRIAFTSRHGGCSQSPYGSLNLSYSVGDDRGNVDSNIRLLLSAMDALDDEARLVNPVQVHGTDLIEAGVQGSAQDHGRVQADGVSCTEPGVPVLLCFADCVPVILVAPGGSFCIVHSGWRGTMGSIAGKGLSKLSEAGGCSPSDVNCYIGPHIRSCCYEVSDELIGRFVARFGKGCDHGRRRLDLSCAVKASLIDAGADGSRIIDAGICTSCRDEDYYSYRSSGGATGRHGAFAIMKE